MKFFHCFLIVPILLAGCIQDGLSLKDAHGIEVQVGNRSEFRFTLENLKEKEYRDVRVEFVDDKWLVRTVSAEIDKPALRGGDSATVKVVLESAKAGENKNARLRLTYSDGGKEFVVPLVVKRDPSSNLTFKLSSLSPMELLAFEARCSG